MLWKQGQDRLMGRSAVLVTVVMFMASLDLNKLNKLMRTSTLMIMMGRRNPLLSRDARLRFNRAQKRQMITRLLVILLFDPGALVASLVLRGLMLTGAKMNRHD